MGFAMYARSGFTPYINTAPPVTGQWFHYCAAWDGIARKIYVYQNGIKHLFGSASNTVGTRPATNHIMMLGHLTQSGPYILDEIYVWEIQLDESQIISLYESY